MDEATLGLTAIAIVGFVFAFFEQEIKSFKRRRPDSIFARVPYWAVGWWFGAAFEAFFSPICFLCLVCGFGFRSDLWINDMYRLESANFHGLLLLLAVSMVVNMVSFILFFTDWIRCVVSLTIGAVVWWVADNMMNQFKGRMHDVYHIAKITENYDLNDTPPHNTLPDLPDPVNVDTYAPVSATDSIWDAHGPRGQVCDDAARPTNPISSPGHIVLDRSPDRGVGTGDHND